MEKRRNDRSPTNNEKKRERNEDEEPDTSKLFVGNLSDRTKEDDLIECFKKYGKIRSVRIISDPTTHRSKGFGFVTFEDSRDGDTAQKATDNKIEIDGRRLVVEIAKGREKRNDRNERYEPNEKRTRRSDAYEASREESYRHDRYPEEYRDRRSMPVPQSRYSDYPPFPVPLPPGEAYPPLHLIPPYGKEDPRYSGWLPRRDYRDSAPLPASYSRRDERDLLRAPVMYPPSIPYPEDYYRVARVAPPPPHMSHSISSDRSHWDYGRDSREYRDSRDYRDDREQMHRSDLSSSHHHRDWESRSLDRNKERDSRDSRDHHKDRSVSSNSNDRKSSRENDNGKEKDRERSKPKDHRDRIPPSHHKGHSS